MLITHANIVTWGIPNQILFDQDILIEDGLIEKIHPHYATSDYKDENILNANFQFVFPGNICAHTHFYGAFARGIAIPGSPPKDFLEILNKLWWPLDRSLTQEDIYYSALLCLIAAIKYGTTTLFDHHSSPNFIDGSLDIISKAVEESGLRAVLCYEVSDRDGEEKTRKGIDENLRFIDKLIKQPNSKINATFGLHANLTLSTKTLELCKQLNPPNVGFHIHAAESVLDQRNSISLYGIPVIERLHRLGILGEKSILAHAVHVSEPEISLLSKTSTWVTHQPRSNMNNGVGIAPVGTLLSAGVKLCLGNDGFQNSMWQEWVAAYLLQKAGNLDPSAFPGNDLIKIAIYNNTALVNSFFTQKPIGIIEVGAAADLIFIDYDPPTPLTPDNLPWHILFGFNESMITTTIVDGILLLKDRKLIHLNETEILSNARDCAKRVWGRFSNHTSTSMDL